MGEFVSMAGIGALLAGLNVGGSALQAEQAYHYAKKMYQHRYQWAVKDMRKSGLNPILAANGGSVAGMGAAPSPDYSGAIGRGFSSAADILSTAKELESKDAQIEKTKTDAELSKAQMDYTKHKTLNQMTKNGILSRQEESLVEDAQARAALNTAHATLQQARADRAEDLAEYESYNKYIGLHKAKYDALGSFWKRHLLRKEYYSKIDPKLARWWNNAESYSKVIKNMSSLWKFL